MIEFCVTAHPHLFNIIETIERGNDSAGFMKEVNKFVNHLTVNAGRSLQRAVTRSRAKSSGKLVEYYESQLGRLASNFALCADLSLSLGGRLKFEEMLSGRFADALGTLFLGYACLWHYQQHTNIQGIEPVFTYAMDTLLVQNQAALLGISKNFPYRSVGFLMRAMCFPFGEVYEAPSDKQRAAVSEMITTPSGIRDLLMSGIFVSKNPNDQLHKLLEAFPQVIKADQMAQAAKKRSGKALTKEEQEYVDRVNALVNELIQVDSFDKLGKEKLADESYVRPGLQNTRFAEMKTPIAVSA
jgi:acyl-CoA dehydrogenase